MKTVPVVDGLRLDFYRATDGSGFGHVILRHWPPVRGMNAEVLIAPDFIPQIIKSLADAAVELQGWCMYLGGREDGMREMAQHLLVDSPYKSKP